MEVNVDIPNLPEVVAKLGEIPNAVRFALHQSIMYTLRRARTEAARAARERYNIPYGWLLKAIGTPSISGLVGLLRVSGTKAPLSMFPIRDIYPYGAAIQELKYAMPINLLHAFVRGGKVLERETPATRRYPLRTMVGLAAPQMIGQRSQVFPKIEAGMAADIDKELSRLIRLILAGDITPK